LFSRFRYAHAAINHLVEVAKVFLECSHNRNLKSVKTFSLKGNRTIVAFPPNTNFSYSHLFLSRFAAPPKRDFSLENFLEFPA
jgi:hypothetical protein